MLFCIIEFIVNILTSVYLNNSNSIASSVLKRRIYYIVLFLWFINKTKYKKNMIYKIVLQYKYIKNINKYSI